jgi:hypothetical protein
MLLGLLAAIGAAACESSMAQARSDPAAGAASAAGRTADEANRPTRLEESIQHGFFGDLSRPSVPALNRIDGVRIPTALPSDSARAHPTAKLPVPAAPVTESKQTPAPTAAAVPGKPQDERPRAAAAEPEAAGDRAAASAPATRPGAPPLASQP